jgi:hypothetical protein
VSEERLATCHGAKAREGGQQRVIGEPVANDPQARRPDRTAQVIGASR